MAVAAVGGGPHAVVIALLCADCVARVRALVSSINVRWLAGRAVSSTSSTPTAAR